jgi:ribosomal protein S18 acetylase RimI-like enzyme
MLSKIESLIRRICRNINFKQTNILFKYTVDKEFSKSDLMIVKATINQIDDLMNFESKNSIKDLKSKVSQGQKCYLAYLDGECVFRSLVIDKPDKVQLNFIYSLSLENDDVYIHYCETHPNYRGKGIYPSVLSYICKAYKANKQIYIVVNENNKSSINGVLKVGFTLAKKVVTTSFLYRKRTTIVDL